MLTSNSGGKDTVQKAVLRVSTRGNSSGVASGKARITRGGKK
jgi:hypothetical protein